MTDILAQDHAEVDALLRDLPSAFEGGSARAVFVKLDYLWARLAVHIRAEHLHLFPALHAAASERLDEERESAPAPPEVSATIERLREDHDFFMHELAGVVNAARELSRQEDQQNDERLAEIRGRVSAIAARLAEHNRVEEERVYRWPEALLGEAELKRLRASMLSEIENLPPRFSEREMR